MIANRSIPTATVIPELGYANSREAADWLCNAFGFAVRLRIANHRIQLDIGDGAIVITEADATVVAASRIAQRMLVRVDNVDAHYARARVNGATVLSEPQDFPFGERQYNALDFDGRRWTFSQTIADVAPETWGGESVRR